MWSAIKTVFWVFMGFFFLLGVASAVIEHLHLDEAFGQYMMQHHGVIIDDTPRLHPPRQ